MGHFVVEIVKAFLSWPAACLVAVLVLHRPIARLVDRIVRSQKGGEVDLGPVKVKLGEVAEGGERAVRALNDLNLVMAESRELELRITDRMFGVLLQPSEREQLQHHIERLRQLRTESEQHVAEATAPTAEA